MTNNTRKERILQHYLTDLFTSHFNLCCTTTSCLTPLPHLVQHYPLFLPQPLLFVFKLSQFLIALLCVTYLSHCTSYLASLCTSLCLLLLFHQFQDSLLSHQEAITHPRIMLLETQRACALIKPLCSLSTIQAMLSGVSPSIFNERIVLVSMMYL